MTHAVHPRSAAASPRQAGMTLIEVLVAFAVFVIVAAAAFIIFTRMRQVEKIGQQAVDQQQVLRITFFDEVVPQLRKAGLNHNPEGNKQLPDEQIEGAWAGAVVFRADLDQDDPAESADPESVIDGPWDAVSIGNDEIIMYALMEPDGTGGSTLQITADLHSTTTTTSPSGTTVAVRDNNQETLSIPNIVTTQTGPPYTLYRITLNNDATTWGSANFIQRQPVADNIMSLEFTYLDAVGNVITPPGGGETDTDISTRKSIKQIQVDMVALTEDPDIFYTDPDDPDPNTRNFRKFTLSSTVQPRNLGRTRVADIDLTKPSTPQNLAACAGHCEGMIVSWDANPVNEGVAEYRVRYGTSPTSLTASRETTSDWMYLPDLADATSYYFQVAAKDAAGNQSSYSSSVIEISRDDVAPTRTTPQNVGGAAATGDGTTPPEDQQITLTWNPVTTNVKSLACDPQAPSIRDLDHYEVHRVGEPSPYTVAPGPNPTYVDTQVIACRSYGYDIVAVDKCGHPSAAPATAYGSATSNVAPERPIGVNAVYSGPGVVELTWNEVSQNTAGTPAAYDTYLVYRQTIPSTSLPDFSTAIQVGYHTDMPGDGTVSWTDAAAPIQTATTTTWYWVLAQDDCPNLSVPSDPAQAYCAFTGTVTISPGDGTAMPTGTISIVVNAAGDVFTGSKLTIFDRNRSPVFTQSQTGPEPWSYTWPGTQAGTYVAEAQVQTVLGCAGSASARWRLIQLVGCAEVQVAGVTTSNGGKQVIFDFVNTSSSSDITLTGLGVVWDNANGGGVERLGALDVGPNPTVLYGGAGQSSPVFEPVSPSVTVPGGGSVQILYEFSKDMTGNRLQTRFDFETAGLGSSAQQCNFQILP